MDNARALLLETAKDYLDHSQLEEATDKQYGKGVTRYIGSAISRYYGEEILSKMLVRFCGNIGVNILEKSLENSVAGVRITVTAILHISFINFCEFCVC